MENILNIRTYVILGEIMYLIKKNSTVIIFLEILNLYIYICIFLQVDCIYLKII